MNQDYSDKEKELIEYYESLPKVSLNISEMERLLKKPLEYAVDLEYILVYRWFKAINFIGEARFDNGKTNFGYEFGEIERVKDSGTQYLCNYSIEENERLKNSSSSIFQYYGIPVREAKGKWLKKFLL